MHISPFPPSGPRGALGPVDLMQCSVLWVVGIFVPRFDRIGSQAGMASNPCMVICQARMAHDRGTVPTLVKPHSGARLRGYSKERGWRLRKVPCEFVLLPKTETGHALWNAIIVMALTESARKVEATE